MSQTFPAPASPSVDIDHHDNDVHTSPSNYDQSFSAADDSIISTSTNSSTLEKHPKGKRKRTAAKDKAILEEAYLSNPKPDKQARLEIVERVSLNEKEVQIWFQNRRQNDRRKSRPLSAQEIEALRYGGMQAFSSDNTTSQSGIFTSDPAIPHATPQASTSSPAHGQISPAAAAKARADASNSSPAVMLGRHGADRREGADLRGDDIPSSQESQGDSQRLSTSFSGSLGYLANRWNLGSSFSSSFSSINDDTTRPEMIPPSSSPHSENISQTQSQSQMRLSLSLEGKAELVSNAPSPTRLVSQRPSSTVPTLPQVRHRSLQRSHSALPTVTLPPISTLTSSLPPRLVRGRSRDVHAWELCADADTRDELTTQAENESNGSAVAAISLLRSSSGALQPSGAKRNAPLNRQPRTVQTKKAKLSRTSSSVARLETDDLDLDLMKENNGKVKVSMLVSPTDSDKENWSPDEDSGAPRRRPLPTTAPAAKAPHPRRMNRVLQDTKIPSLLANRANTAPLPRTLAKEALEIFEDSPENRKTPKPAEEVERFMNGELSPSKKPDMDCVAGLLSLSQGAWSYAERSRS
ncbi:hypothetical protein B0I35DRAFT_224509 [Stachybotrys elegans]|uniref:Homeobox domain-containing protein n=1 Tax=Stachybotrys elegans TaxID=80388 RepID=A0A8K0SWQ9_9HYPO|nr:hypothetical protein B0I35DRAFT_224509 [Stachybotrys elegans]